MGTNEWSKWVWLFVFARCSYDKDTFPLQLPLVMSATPQSHCGTSLQPLMRRLPPTEPCRPGGATGAWRGNARRLMDSRAQPSNGSWRICLSAEKNHKPDDISALKGCSFIAQESTWEWPKARHSSSKQSLSALLLNLFVGVRQYIQLRIQFVHLNQHAVAIYLKNMHTIVLQHHPLTTKRKCMI